MSLVTKTLHRQNWETISASNPKNAQTGRTILITGGCGTIGFASAQAFITAGAGHVIITSRDGKVAEEKAAELENDKELNKAGGKVTGLQLDVGEADDIAKLWDGLAEKGVEVDVLVLNATKMNPPVPEGQKLSYTELYSNFDHMIKLHLVSIDRFANQGKSGKNLIYVSTNAIHLHNLGQWYSQTCAARAALTRLLQDAAGETPASEMQIINLHPGFVLTESNKTVIPEAQQSQIPFDDKSLPANFYVWAASKNAAFLHGRFVWANWDVDELREEYEEKFEKDGGFLKVGVQGIASQDMGMLFEGMMRSV